MHANRVIGKKNIDLETAPPPDLVVEIDTTNESLGKFPVYAALQISEIWHCDAKVMRFYSLSATGYEPILKSRSFPNLNSEMIATVLEESKISGQSVALRAFRAKFRAM